MGFLDILVGRGKPPKRVLPLDLSKLDVPRYPPHKGGFPICDSESCLATQKDIIDRIRHTLRMSKDDFERIVIPVLLNMTDYIHLLPASKNHHHRLVGGLLRHSLEVGYFCAQSANAMIFGAHVTNASYREKLRQRMLMAAFTTGIIHDVGKVVSDMRISVGNHWWNPYVESLKDFIGQHVSGSDVYMLNWNKNRIYSQHELFSVVVLNRILTTEYVQHLTDKRFIEVVESIVATVANSRMIQEGSDAHLLVLILKSAEKRSIRRDMVGERQVAGTDNAPLPLPLQIAYKINQLVEDGVLIPNNQGARCFCSESGVYIDWDEAFGKLLAEHMGDDGIRIPVGVDEQTRMLTETGVIVSTDGRTPNVYSLFFKEKNGVVLQRKVVQLINELFKPIIDVSDGRDRVRVEISYGTPLDEKFRKMAKAHIEDRSEPDAVQPDKSNKDEIKKTGKGKTPTVQNGNAAKVLDGSNEKPSWDSSSNGALDGSGLITPGLADAIAESIVKEELRQSNKGVGATKPAKDVAQTEDEGKSGGDKDIFSLMSEISVDGAVPVGEKGVGKKVKPKAGGKSADSRNGNDASTTQDSEQVSKVKPEQHPPTDARGKDDPHGLPGLVEVLLSEEFRGSFAVDINGDRVDVVATRRELCGYLSRKLGISVHIVTKYIDKVAEVSRMKNGTLKFRFMTDKGVPSSTLA
jgi:hypothetical protein